MPPEAPQARPGPGRPSSGARERILDAALEVLKADGYAGLTTAKVAACSGQNKALISYHFGSKQGLVAEVARTVSAAFTEDLLHAVGASRNARALTRGAADGLAAFIARDAGLARLYFDLAAQSTVDPEVRAIMAEMKSGYRAVLREQLARVSDGPSTSAATEATAVYILACLEGLMLEQMENGETAALKRARRIFVESVGDG